MNFALHTSAAAVLETDQPATEKAYRAVLDSIVSRSAPAGELISEGQVAEGLGMSRTPVREAFLRLSAEGLLDLYPKRGAVVTVPTAEETRELMQTRAMFEVSAVGWIADRGAPDRLAGSLQEVLAQQAETSQPLAFARSDFAFHEAIVAAGGNAVATRLFSQIGPRLLRYWYGAAEDQETRGRLEVEHGRLVDLVLANDVKGYAEAIESHIEWSRHALDNGWSP